MDEAKKEMHEIEQRLSHPELLSTQEQIQLSRRYGELAKLTKPRNTTPGSSQDHQEIIIEIRAGTGGEEASLFAKNLFQMYTKFAERKQWRWELIDESLSPLGGIKSIAFTVHGKGAFTSLEQESGVHRVQRIPVTEKSGRIHTSTASVAILKQPKESEVNVRPQDIEISFFRSSGPGGQNVNKVETGVRLLHKPSGLVVESQTGRFQQKNREHAMKLLLARLLEREQLATQKEMTEERRKQIGGAERAEKIRTYNFPQDRITDHRIKKSWGNIQEILNGDLERIIKEFQKDK